MLAERMVNVEFIEVGNFSMSLTLFPCFSSVEGHLARGFDHI